MAPPSSLSEQYNGKGANAYSLVASGKTWIYPTWVDGAIIVGAGPSGLATAACLKEQGVRSVILEKSDCIASLWQQRTYDRLQLHTPKGLCELPLLPIPNSFPTYPTREQFIDYLTEYAEHFNIKPRFGERVEFACFDETCKVWRVQTIDNSSSVSWTKTEYLYYGGGKVLVVGSGNSGMEIALDLTNFDAMPSIVVRNPVHVLPREVFGKSTYSVAMTLLQKVPLWLADALLVCYAYLTIGSTSKYGIKRPKKGPLAMKEKLGRTPILDIGTFDKIKSGCIKVMPAIESLTASGARFVDGQCNRYSAIILATGYTCNIPWLKGEEDVFSDSGTPKCGWKGRRGLYFAGISRKGLLGAAKDAKLIAEDIKRQYKSR